MPPVAKRKRRRAKSPYSKGESIQQERRKEYLLLVRKLSRDLGRCPSANDIALALNISRLGARRMMIALEEAGLVSDIPKMVRSGEWQLTELGEKAIDES